MVERAHFLQNLHLAMSQVRRRGLQDGCFVECGTWAGGTSFGMMHVLPEIKSWHFFDSYEGLPPATALDGQNALRQQQESKLWHENNTADYDTFVENAKRARRPGQKFEVHRGWFQDTLPGFTAERPISVLRMDGDWYESTTVILDCLYDQVSEGGLVLIDDYQAWPGCSRAVHDFFSKRNVGEVIRECRGVFYFIRDRQRGRI